MAPFASKVRKLQKKGDLEKLVELLNDKNPGVRAEARFAIVELHDPRAIFLLVQAVQRGEGWSLSEAAQALLAIRDERAIEMLVAVLETATSFHAKGTAIDLLADLGDERAIEPLADQLNDSDEAIRGRSAKALKGFGPKSHEVLKKRLRGDPVSDLKTLQTLMDLGDEDASERLMSVVADRFIDSETRCEAAIFLRQIVNQGKANSQLGESWERVQEVLEGFRSNDASLRFLVYEFEISVLAGEIAQVGSRLAQLGDAALEPLLTALGDHGMLARYKAAAPMTSEEAGALILELSRARIEHLGSLHRS